MRWLLTLILGICMVPAVVACGGDDDDDTASTATVAPSPTVAATATAPAVSAETAPVLPASVTDKDGKTVQVKDVSRIVVLNGDIAEVVYALGLGDNVVGTDTSATYPEGAKAKQSIGYQRTLSAEGIISLKPTLVIGNEVAGPAAVLEQVRATGVTTVLLKDVTSLEGVYEKIANVSTALGVPNRGTLLNQQVKTDVDAATALAAKATSKPKVAFLYLRGASTQQIMGSGSRADVLIAAAGGVDAGVAAGVKGSAPITAESLVTAAPDVLLLLSAGLQSVGGTDGLLKIPGISETPAGKSKRVVDLDDQYLLGMGPRTGLALMDLVKALHPELK